MNKVLLSVLLVAAIAYGATRDYKPLNSFITFEDSILVDSTEVHYTKAFWLDNMAHKSLLIEAKDTNLAGWYQDTSAVKIEILQAFPIDDDITANNAFPYFVVLKSHANPDSTSISSVQNATFTLYDSLRINTMDTSSVWSRDSSAVTDRDGSTLYYNFGDSLDTKQTSQTGAATTGFGAMAYSALPFDFSPAAVIRITGLSTNNKTGYGTYWKFRLYQENGIPVKTK